MAHQAMPTQPAPKPDAAQHARKRAAVATARRFRHQLLPVLAMVVTWLAGAALYLAELERWVIALTGAAAAAGAWLLAWRLDRLFDQSRKHAYAFTCVAAVTLWLTFAASQGVLRPMAAWLAGGGGTLAFPWWWRYRLRGTPEAEPATAEPAEDPRIAEWATKVARPGGPLEHSRLLYSEDIRGGWAGVIEVLRGNTDRAVMATKDIGAALKLRAGSIVIEPTAEGELHLARVLVLPNNPLAKRVDWTGPTLNVQTGVSFIGWYADMEPVPYRHYRPGSGPVHDLIAGCTDSGKSRTVEQLLAEERHSGVIISQVIDPQGGASLPDWQDHVDRYARTIAEARVLLTDARDRMYARNAFMASVEWTDDKGRRRKGIGQFTPGDPRHGLYMLSITTDEAQTVLADPVCKALVEEMIGMSRKCGIKFRLITQVPLLSSLGNSMVIRDAVAAGNVLVLRTANRLSGQVAFNGALPVDPCMLPKEFPDGSTTSGLGFVFGPGADRPSTMRVGYVEDPFHWATSGNPAVLETYTGPVRGSDGASQTAPQPSAGGPSPDDAELQRIGEDAVLAYLVARDGAEANRGELIAHIQADVSPPPALRTITKALTDLNAAGDIERTGRGMYRITDRGNARLAEQPPEREKGPSMASDDVATQVAEVLSKLDTADTTARFNEEALKLATANGWTLDYASNHLYARITERHPQIAGLIGVALLTEAGQL